MIDLEAAPGCQILRINRPDKANALTAGMLDALIAHLEAVPEDVPVLILTGAGDKVFSSGADLEEAKKGLTTSPLWERLSAKIAAMPCLTIAALNGTLAGGAFGMVLACDMRIAIPGAKFFHPVARLGFFPQPSDPKRLCALIGPARTKALLVAGEKIEAETAHLWGLIDYIDRAPLKAALTRAMDLKAADPRHLARIKAMCHQASG